MKKSIRVSAVLLAAGALAVLLAVGLANKSVLSPRATAQEDPRREEARLMHERRRRLHAMPEIVNATSSLRLVHAEIEPRGPADDDLRLALRNESPKSIISFTVCLFVDEEEGYRSMTFYGPEEDSEVLAPYAETTVDVSAGNIEPGKPVTLCAVMFADETQEGVGHVIESHKQSREKAKRRRPN